MDAPEPPTTFIVRVRRSPSGELTGVVERVRTGAKHQFLGAEALGRVIEDACQAAARERHDEGRYDDGSMPGV